MESVIAALAANPPTGQSNSGTIFRKSWWRRMRRTLCGPCIRSGLLTLLLPELKGIDALVIRDYSHRLTVDEHTFVAIENLHKLRQSHTDLGPAICRAAR